MPSPTPPQDLARHLEGVLRAGTSLEGVDHLIGDALEALAALVPYELATVMERCGDALEVRVARGVLAGDAVRDHRLDLARFPSLREVLKRGEAKAFDEHEHDHSQGDGDPFDGVLDLPHGHSCMVVPLVAGDETLGLMTFDHSRCERYSDATLRIADVFGRLLAVAIEHGHQSAVLASALEQAREQNRVLAQRQAGSRPAGALIEDCPSPGMQQIAAMARQVAAADTPVLITGETGTGKEVLARALHEYSPRRAEPMVSLNCAALPPNLIESELFGHVAGAFSGATGDRLGRFRAADGGTLFLDEVGELPLDLQAKLLRVLQDGSFEPVGSDRSVRVDVRILAATNRDLKAAAAEGEFREDLYYRLAVFPLHLPPLRARREDVLPIARNLLADLSSRRGQAFELADDAAEVLQGRDWPGNVRELVNALERATILARGARLAAADFDPVPGAPAAGTATRGPGTGEGPLPTLEEVERAAILRTLAHTEGRVYGAEGAAAILGMPGSTLRSRMKKLGLGGARDHRRDRG